MPEGPAIIIKIYSNRSVLAPNGGNTGIFQMP